MAKKEKVFNYKLYSVVAFVLVAAILATITSITFKKKYIAYHPDEVADNFTQTVVESGDGYNGLKYAALSVNMQQGDFIRRYYIYPIIYKDCGYSSAKGEVTKEMEDSKKALNNEGFMSQADKDDEKLGEKAGQLADVMYPVYEQLVQKYGWDDYDSIFTQYFARLQTEREKIFGDKYLTDEIMFTAIEANVTTYGNSVKGTETVYADDDKTVLQKAVTGAYQKAYGKNYKLTYAIKGDEDLNLDEYKAKINTSVMKLYEISQDDITGAKKVTVDVAANGKQILELPVYIIKIKNSWYVDNTTTDTSSVYKLQASLKSAAD